VSADDEGEGGDDGSMDVKRRQGTFMWALMITNLFFAVLEAFS